MIDCNHVYVETDAKGTIECTECGITSLVEYPQREGTTYHNTKEKTESLKNAIEEYMGDTCRNGKPWDSCTCC
tara:strand:- start:58 stop:276 length:219 start_codon:yes stop_codon:yes gene_type:complete